MVAWLSGSARYGLVTLVYTPGLFGTEMGDRLRAGTPCTSVLRDHAVTQANSTFSTRPAHVVQWSNHLGAMCSRA